MQHGADGMEGLFGDMWDLEVPVSPPLSYGEITPPIENSSPALSPSHNTCNIILTTTDTNIETPQITISQAPLVAPKEEELTIIPPPVTFVSSTIPTSNSKKRKSVSVSLIFISLHYIIQNERFNSLFIFFISYNTTALPIFARTP